MSSIRFRHDEDIDRGRVIRMVGGSFALLGVVAAIALYFAVRFVEDERERALHEWQIRLGIVADSRVAAIDEWLDAGFAVVSDLAANDSLRLYMTELALAGGDRAAVTDEAAQSGYLRNLLVATAERNDFEAPARRAPDVANLPRPGVAGLGLFAADGSLIAASADMPGLDGPLRAAFEAALQGKRTFIDMFRGPGGPVVLGFALPVYGIQDDPNGPGLGVVIGVRIVGLRLFSRLAQPGEVAKTSESYLVRRTGGAIDYLSPLADGTQPLQLSLAADTSDLAAAFALAQPGGFAVRTDYSGLKVLVTARAVPGTPWMLARKITHGEALAEAERRLKTMLTVLVLLIVGISVTIVAVWRHGTSVRAAEAAHRFKVAAERFENLHRFMRVVSDAQPTEVFVLDGDGRYTFANLTAARLVGIDADDMLGKKMAAVTGPARADIHLTSALEVISTQRPKTSIETEPGPDNAERVVKVAYIPLQGDRDHPPGALTVLDDITELTRERRRAEQRLMELVDTLVSVVDRRDPYSANHSTRVAEVARTIAREMGLSDASAGTCELAGRLMNLGKIFVPIELLTKTSSLTGEERGMLHGSFHTSAELLRGVDFGGPVVETIAQIAEAWDGSGRLGLAGSDIIETARVVALANTFVGMVSPRAYREALPFDEATQTLLSDAERLFDRRAVLALVNYLENKGGRTQWRHFGDALSG